MKPNPAPVARHQQVAGLFVGHQELWRAIEEADRYLRSACATDEQYDAAEQRAHVRATTTGQGIADALRQEARHIAAGIEP